MSGSTGDACVKPSAPQRRTEYAVLLLHGEDPGRADLASLCAERISEEAERYYKVVVLALFRQGRSAPQLDAAERERGS
jgi:hypothetical protein